MNSRERRHAARRAERNASRNEKSYGTASFVRGHSPLTPENVGAKTAGRMTCYVPGALCRVEHKRKLSKRWGDK